MSMLYLLIQCDDSNNINKNITLRQDKMLIKSVTLTKSFKVTQVLN